MILPSSTTLPSPETLPGMTAETVVSGEEQRAADYRAQCMARKAYIQTRAVALKGTMGTDVADAWRPLLEALADQTSVCDNTAPDVAQLGQLTSETG